MKDRIRTKDYARGRWDRILPTLGVNRKFLSGRNGPCMFCGGKDRARFTDHEEDGWYYCNQCGSYDGFKVLMKLHNWTFSEAAKQVDRVLGTNALVSMSKENYPQTISALDMHISKSTKDAAVWLKAYRSKEELEDFLARHHPEVRWWLETRE